MSTLTVISEIAAERRRQIEAEGWTSEHDDAHTQRQMARAAAAYAYYAGLNDEDRDDGKRPETFVRFLLWKLYPAWGTAYGGWSESWWKPTNRRRDLIKAAALIVAEIERLDRKESDT